MPAPKDNKYAQKADGERVAFPVNVRGTASERKAWRKAAAGQKWNEWARAALNNSAGYLRDEPAHSPYKIRLPEQNADF
jgi:hypothetical protein